MGLLNEETPSPPPPSFTILVGDLFLPLNIDTTLNLHISHVYIYFGLLDTSLDLASPLSLDEMEKDNLNYCINLIFLFSSDQNHCHRGHLGGPLSLRERTGKWAALYGSVDSSRLILEFPSHTHTHLKN